MMLLNLAWRNVWRNKRRSIIILISVAVGVVATVLMDTLSRGMVYQMLENQVGSHVSHIEIHRTGFNDNPVIQSTVPDAAAVEKALQNTPGIAHWSKRVLTYGLVSSATSSSGVQIVGIDPESEQKVTTIDRSLVEGRYLSGGPNEAVIGKSLAEKLNVGLGDRLVAMASAVDGHVGSDLFRVVGLFETVSSEFDKSNIYVSRANAQQMLGLGDRVSEFAMVLTDLNDLDQIKESLQKQLGTEYEVLTYPEILPTLVLMIEVTEQSMIIFYALIGIALIFGIINTMLMAIFERIHELGVLKAIGLLDRKLVAMVLWEAFFLGTIGTAVGFTLSYLIYLPLSQTGIDLTIFSDSLRSFGVGTTIYPVLTWGVIADALLVIPIIAVLGALYPALRAARLGPVEAIRYV